MFMSAAQAYALKNTDNQNNMSSIYTYINTYTERDHYIHTCIERDHYIHTCIERDRQDARS